MRKVNLLSISISLAGYSTFIDTIIASAKARENHYVCLANVHMLIEAYFNKKFSNVVRDANMIAPDGKPLTWALKLLYGIKQERVAGMDLLPNLLLAASKENLSVYFYGGTDEILLGTKKHIEIFYPHLTIAGTYSPPFTKPSKEDEETAIKKINQSGANLVFVILGCPKQEKWMSSVHQNINAVLVGIGGALPVVIGVQKRAPKWMQNKGLEWLFRLALEPTRLFKRYAITNTIFLYLLIKEYFSMKITKRNFHTYEVQQ